MAKQGKIKLSNIFVWAILALLIVGLAGFGATNFGNARQAVATVGNADVSMNSYYRSLESELRAFSAQIGRNLTLAEARSFGVDQQVLGRLLGSAAIEHETELAGLSAGDETLALDIRSRPEFQGIGGNFDTTAYQFALERVGLSVPEFEDSIRAEIAGGLLQSAVAANATMPKSYSENLVRFLGERRSFSWLTLSESDLQEALPEPSSSDLRAYYDNDPEVFMLPEQRNITFAWLRPEDVLDEVNVSEDELRALYDERADLYNLPERRLVERLIFGDLSAAESALDQITKGESTFEDIVEARGLELEDVDMGDVTAEELGNNADAVFALNQPGLVGPVETNLGPAIYRINGILSARVTEFEDVVDDLRNEFAGDQARRMISDRIAELDDLLAGGATVEDLAKEAGMVLGELDWSLENTSDIAAYEEFSSAAAQASVDDFPEILELSDGGIFAMRLNSVTPSAPEAFESATTRVAEAWANDQLQTALTELAAELVAQVENGARLSALGYITSVETRAGRSSFLDDAPGNLISRIFEAEQGRPVVVEGDGSAVVAVVNEVHMADPSDPELAQIAEAIAADAGQSMANDFLISFTRAVQTEAGITVDQAALNAIHTQFP